MDMNTLTTLTPMMLQLALGLSILLVALVTLRKKSTVEKLKKDKEEALQVILFLLANEEKHCEEHQFQQGKSLKNTMRHRVTMETDFTWNPKFSKSSCLKDLEKMKANNNDVAFLTEFFKGLLLKSVK